MFRHRMPTQSFTTGFPVRKRFAKLDNFIKYLNTFSIFAPRLEKQLKFRLYETGHDRNS